MKRKRQVKGRLNRSRGVGGDTEEATAMKSRGRSAREAQATTWLDHFRVPRIIDHVCRISGMVEETRGCLRDGQRIDISKPLICETGILNITAYPSPSLSHPTPFMFHDHWSKPGEARPSF